MPRYALRRPKGFIALALGCTLLTVFVGAQAPSPTPTDLDRATAQFVALLIERGHISNPTINDDIAKDWAKNFISGRTTGLDPLKYHFLKEDVDEFMAQATTLDDKIREGNLDWARQVFARFLQRSDERLADAMEILKQEPDFTLDETIVDDPELLDFPADAAEARERLRKRIKFDLLRVKLGKKTPEEALRQLTIRYKDINRSYKLFSSQDLLEQYLTALTVAVDPHSQYMQATTLEDFYGTQLHLSLEGIGASLTTEDGFPVVKEIVPGGAADQDGRLEVEDKIVGIEVEDGEPENFVGKKLSDVVRKIRGPAGSKVRLIVQPHAGKEQTVYEMTRQKIELKESHAKGKVIDATGPDGRPMKLGIISLPMFYGDTDALLEGDPEAVSATRDCRKILGEFKAQKVDAVVMDLRLNGGGLLNEAITLSGLFIDEGPVVQVREPFGVRHMDDEEKGTAWDGPLAVVVDRFSASASEIFAGVIKDYGRGLIIGDRATYGKGTVQHVVPLNQKLRLREDANIPNLGALKLTIQQFYRPNGNSTQIKGVQSDVHIPSFRDHSDLCEDKIENALKFDEVPPLPHDEYPRVPAGLVSRLQARSDARRAESAKFKQQDEAIQKYLDRKARHEISLNEATFRSEMMADDEAEEAAADSPSGKDKKQGRHAERDAWESNFYNDEVVAIVADYIGLGGEVLTAGPVHVAHDADRPALRP